LDFNGPKKPWEENRNVEKEGESGRGVNNRIIGIILERPLSLPKRPLTKGARGATVFESEVSKSSMGRRKCRNSDRVKRGGKAAIS